MQRKLPDMLDLQPLPVPFPDVVNGRNGDIDGQAAKQEEHHEDDRQPFALCDAPAHPAQAFIRPVLHPSDATFFLSCFHALIV